MHIAILGYMINMVGVKEMHKVLKKENVFSCVTFGAILVYAIVQTHISSEYLPLTVCLLSIVTLGLSILQLGINIFEDIIDKQTKLLKEREEFWKNSEFVTELREYDNKEIGIFIHHIADMIDEEELWKYSKEDVKEYKDCYEIRKLFRIWRRVILFIFYALTMLVLIILLLRVEIFEVMRAYDIQIFDTSVLTIWSLVVMLLEIMTKDFIEDILIVIFEKVFEIDLSYL